MAKDRTILKNDERKALERISHWRKIAKWLDGWQAQAKSIECQLIKQKSSKNKKSISLKN